jgi:hypothetical protein
VVSSIDSWRKTGTDETRTSRHFAKYHGRRATFSYYFENGVLTGISVCFNNSSEKEFKQMHSRLSADFGPLPAAAPAQYYQLSSKGEFDGLEIEHWLRDFEEVGVTEMIRFGNQQASKA